MKLTVGSESCRLSCWRKHKPALKKISIALFQGLQIFIFHELLVSSKLGTKNKTLEAKNVAKEDVTNPAPRPCCVINL